MKEYLMCHKLLYTYQMKVAPVLLAIQKTLSNDMGLYTKTEPESSQTQALTHVKF